MRKYTREVPDDDPPFAVNNCCRAIYKTDLWINEVNVASGLIEFQSVEPYVY